MIELYRTLLALLDPRERLRLFFLMGLIMLQGVFDMAGVAAILPFLAIVADPSLIESNRFYSAAYDLAGAPDTQTFLIYAATAVIAVILTGLVVKVVTLYAIARFSHMRRYHFSQRLLTGILRQNYDWFLNRHGAHLSKLVLTEVDRLVGSSMIPGLKILSHMVSLVFVGTLLLIVDPVMALSAILTIGSVYGVIYAFVRRRLQANGEIQVSANTERFRIAQESLSGIKEVKVEGLEEVFASRFRAPSYRMARSHVAVQVIGEMPRFVLETVIFGGIVLVVLVRLSGPGSSVEELLPILGLFAVAGLRMFPSIQQIYHSLSLIRSGQAIVAEVAEHFFEVGRPDPAKPAPTPLGLKREFCLEAAEYTYPGSDRSVLNGLDMTIPALASVGIVGGTGAGKTTAVDIMLGLLDADGGRLVVDGQTIQADNRRAWQRSIGYVPQSIFLVDDTISANIAFGVDPGNIDQGAVERAARLAELHDFVETDLPEGYATEVGERGVRLSGGQRQRIGIARSLYHDPDVLILDEATSALDNLTERAVMDAVQNIGGRKTVIMIAHRLTTVRNCDLIYLLEEGRVAAQGTYQELIEGNATFRAMAEAS